MSGVMTRDRRLRIPASRSSLASSFRTLAKSNVVEAPSVLSEETPDSSSARSRSIFCRLVSLMVSIVQDADPVYQCLNGEPVFQLRSRDTAERS